MLSEPWQGGMPFAVGLPRVVQPIGCSRALHEGSGAPCLFTSAAFSSSIESGACAVPWLTTKSAATKAITRMASSLRHRLYPPPDRPNLAFPSPLDSRISPINSLHIPYVTAFGESRPSPLEAPHLDIGSGNRIVTEHLLRLQGRPQLQFQNKHHGLMAQTTSCSAKSPLQPASSCG